MFWQFRTFEKLVTKTPKNNPVCASPEKGALKQLRGFFKARETETLHPLWPQWSLGFMNSTWNMRAAGVGVWRGECHTAKRWLATPENREIKKMKFSFFHQRHELSTSFDIFVVTYRVTKFLLKLIDTLLFSLEKSEFLFFWIPLFSGIAEVVDQRSCSSLKNWKHQKKTPNRIFVSPYQDGIKAPFTLDAEHLATGACKLWNTLLKMGVFTQVASNIRGFATKFARKSAYASCVNGALAVLSHVMECCGLTLCSWEGFQNTKASWIFDAEEQ